MKLAGLNIMITGAAGFIGSHLAERLAADNRLVLVDDLSVGLRENLAALEGRETVRIVIQDITNCERLRELMAGIDVVFHLAISCLRTSINHPVLSHDINAGGTLNACLAAHENRVKRFVYVSSSEVYGSAQTVPMSEQHPCAPTTVYGASKLAGELYALAFWRTFGMAVTVVRPFNTYGPREPYQGRRAEVIPRFILQLEHGRAPVIYGDGSQTRDFTFVDDTVNGILRAGECDQLVGDVVNIAFGHEVSIRRVAELLADLVGDQSRKPLRVEPRPGDVDRQFADISKSKRLLSFAPPIDLETGLARTVEWFKANQISKRVSVRAATDPNW